MSVSVYRADSTTAHGSVQRACRDDNSPPTELPAIHCRTIPVPVYGLDWGVFASQCEHDRLAGRVMEVPTNGFSIMLRQEGAPRWKRFLLEEDEKHARRIGLKL